VFGSNAPVNVTIDADFDTGPYQQHLISTINHNGSHVDVPSHFHPAGATLSDLDASTWRFESPLLVDVPVGDDHLIVASDLAPVLDGSDPDLNSVMIRTGFGAVRDTEPDHYIGSNPGFGRDAADFLRTRFPRLRAAFCDIPSYTAAAHTDEGIAWHRRMLGAEDDRFVLLFEDISIPPGLPAPRSLWAVPMRLRGLDGAPVTVIAEVD
jgi:arylformamidase